jgi:hypothetical protein
MNLHSKMWRRALTWPVAMKSSQKLVGNARPADFISAFEAMDPAFIKSFNSATDGEKTWFGTYIANSFGSGLLKALKGPIAGESKHCRCNSGNGKNGSLRICAPHTQEADRPCRTEWLSVHRNHLYLFSKEKNRRSHCSMKPKNLLPLKPAHLSLRLPEKGLHCAVARVV